MKKLTALLIAMMMTACTFTACGDDDDDDDSSSKKKKSTTSSMTTDDEDDDDEDTTAKKTTEAATKDDDDNDLEEEVIGKWECVKVIDEDGTYDGEYEGMPLALIRMEIKKNGKGEVSLFGEELSFEWSIEDGKVKIVDEDDDTQYGTLKKNKLVLVDDDEVEMTFEKVDEFSDVELPTENNGGNKKPSGGKVDSNIVGTWNTKEGGFDGSYTFDRDGYGSVSLDASSMYYFDGDQLYIGTQSFGPDTYDFDGTHFNLSINGTDFFVTEKISGGKDTLDGEYEITDGYFFDQFDPQYNNTDDYYLTIVVDGKKFYFKMYNCFTFTADGEEIEFIEGSSLMNSSKAKYSIDGDKMTLEVGISKQEFTRA